jgi:hypothetical protein
MARVIDDEAVWVYARLGYKVTRIGQMSEVKCPRRRRQGR